MRAHLAPRGITENPALEQKLLSLPIGANSEENPISENTLPIPPSILLESAFWDLSIDDRNVIDDYNVNGERALDISKASLAFISYELLDIVSEDDAHLQATEGNGYLEDEFVVLS